MDESMGRWHSFSDQHESLIAAQFADENIELLAEVLRHALGNDSPIQFDSADEFAVYVLQLRSNERAWSRHLGSTLLQAQEALDRGHVVEAADMLSDFRAQCPWRQFAEIAATQLENISGA